MEKDPQQMQRVEIAGITGQRTRVKPRRLRKIALLMQVQRCLNVRGDICLRHHGNAPKDRLLNCRDRQ